MWCVLSVVSDQGHLRLMECNPEVWFVQVFILNLVVTLKSQSLSKNQLLVGRRPLLMQDGRTLTRNKWFVLT